MRHFVDLIRNHDGNDTALIISRACASLERRGVRFTGCGLRDSTFNTAIDTDNAGH